METAIPLPTTEIADFCERWNIEKLEVFGSILRDDFGENSDIDFLVTWTKGLRPNYSELLKAEEDLARLVKRPVDLVSRDAVESADNWLRRDYILNSAQEIYGKRSSC